MLKSLKQIKYLILLVILVIVLGAFNCITFADNPLVTTDYYADPSCRVFNGTMYVYGSHDILNSSWFKMRDYHVWSSTDGVKWTDHGVALDKSNVPWVDQNQDTMWAPDCVYKNGTYYLFFPAVDTSGANRIGVATSSSPTGPFTAQSNYLANVVGIDPCVYFDDIGDAYMYWGTNASPYKIMVSRLNSDLLSVATTPAAVTISGIPSYSLIEGPWVHKYNGQIYLSVPVCYSGTEDMDYAIGTSPTGPFTYKGRIFDKNSIYTIHGSIVNYNSKWYAFYHDACISGNQYARSWRAEEFQYNADGTIPKLTKTIRGIGTANAFDLVQVDRYNSASSGIQSTSAGGGEPTGWVVSSISDNSWVQYNNVDFTSTGPSYVSARVASPSGGASIQVRLDSTSGTLLGTISVPATGSYTTWTTVSTSLSNTTTGVHNLVLVFGTGAFNLNWVQFSATLPTAAPTATPAPTPTPRSAFTQIEAESYNSQSGIQTETCGEGGQNIGYIENGDYTVYNNIDFGSGATSFQARVASATSGGNIEIRLDSISGTLVGTCPIAGTGGWQTWTTKTCSVSGASGLHNLYLKFTGGSGYLFNMNWFKFTSGATATPTPTPTSTATPTPTPVPVDMYVNDITMSSGRSGGSNYYAKATVWIVSATGANVANATVTGNWSGVVSGSSNGVTGADGKVTLQSSNKKNGGTFTFTVTNVTATGYQYNSALNVMTSNSITAP